MSDTATPVYENVVALRERILASDDLTSESVEVPQWNVTVEVRSMTGRTRSRLLKKAVQEDGTLDLERLYPELVIATAHDPETGTPLFNADDQDALLEKNGAALEVIAQAAMRVSGIGSKAVDEAG